MKYIKIFSILLFVGLLFQGCGLTPIDSENVLSDLDIGEVNKNEAQEIAEKLNPFIFTSVTKDGLNIVNVTSVTNDGSIPIVLTFDGGTISSFGDLSITIYKLNSDGTRGNTVSIVSNRIANYLTSSEVRIFTENLGNDTTYEFVISASSTKNSMDVKLDNDGDLRGGETEDDVIFRFSTGTTLIVDNWPIPDATITIPNLNPGNINPGTSTINNLEDTTNGSAIDTSSLSDAIKLLSITENKEYSIRISYSYDTVNRNIIINYPSSLPFGAYKLIVDKRKIKESAPINGYVHRGSYIYDELPTEYSFKIVSTNTQPTLTITKADTHIAKVECNVDLDMSSFNISSVIVYDYSNNRSIPFEIITVDSRTVLIKAKPASSGVDFNITVNNSLDLILNLSKIKSKYGDVVGATLDKYL